MKTQHCGGPYYYGVDDQEHLGGYIVDGDPNTFVPSFWEALS